MSKSGTGKSSAGKAGAGKAGAKASTSKMRVLKTGIDKVNGSKPGLGKLRKAKSAPSPLTAQAAPSIHPVGPDVLDRLWATVVERRSADPETSHSARLLSRGTAKVAQKFGEEAVECLIEAVAKNPVALVAESADVLYHLIVMWVAAGVEPAEIWAELQRREGVSGIAEKMARPAGTTRKIP